MTPNNTSDNTPTRSIRVRKLLDEWLFAVVLGVVLLALVGGWVAYQTHVEPGVVTHEETVSSWQEQTELSHHAEVVRPNPVFTDNQTLSNQPAYFTEISPILGGTYEYSYSASDSGELDVEVVPELHIQAVDDEGDPYWRQTESLNQTRYGGLSPGETATVPVEINVSEAMQEIERTESALGTSIGTTEVAVVFGTRVSGTVNDERVAGFHRERLHVDPDGETFVVETDEGVQETHETTRTVETEAAYGPIRSYGPFGLILVSVAGLGALLVLKHRGRIPPSETELAALERHQEREEFDDWISRGRIPPEAMTGSRIELDSLEDLVDIAIDTNSRVVEDADSGAFVVTGENWHYTVSGDAFETTLLDFPSNGDGVSTQQRTATNGGDHRSTDSDESSSVGEKQEEDQPAETTD